MLLFHGGQLAGGYLGVDLFFTLSGFLITSLLLAESTRTGSVGLGGFWSRRARRLLPALAVLMVAVALYCVLVAHSDELNQIRGDALATLAYGANWRAVSAHQDYWALFRSPSPLNHTWSLAIEEQFYVAWPLIFVALLARWKRSTATAVFVVAVGLACISSVLMMTLSDPNNTARADFGTDTRAAAILFGAALAAWLAMRGPSRHRMALELVGVLAALGLAVAWTRLDGQSAFLYRGGFLLCGLAGTAVIAAAVHPEAGLVSRVLSFLPLCALGWISYGVYLYHWPIDIVLDGKRTGLGGWSLFALQTAVTLAVAVLSYRWIEQPIRHGAISAEAWRVLTPAIAAALVVLLAVSTLGGHTQVVQTATGETMVRDARNAARSAPSKATRVLVVGNSVGYFMAIAMRDLHTSPPLAVFNGAYEACTFPPEITEERLTTPEGATVIKPTIRCDPSWESSVIAAFRPDVVFWIVSGASPAPQRYRDQWLLPCGSTYESLYERSLKREVGVLGAHGAKVVVTTAAYPFVFAGAPHSYDDCDNRLRRKVAAETGAKLADLFEYVCPRNECRERQDGVLLRPDGLHYEGGGGAIVARWLIDQVR